MERDRDVSDIGRDKLSETLAELLRGHLNFLSAGADLPLHAKLSDLGLDSMSAVNLIFELEQAFGVVLPDHLLVRETFDTRASLEAAITSVLI
jgi:acyl carrier protein